MRNPKTLNRRSGESEKYKYQIGERTFVAVSPILRFPVSFSHIQSFPIIPIFQYSIIPLG